MKTKVIALLCWAGRLGLRQNRFSIHNWLWYGLGLPHRAYKRDRLKYGSNSGYGDGHVRPQYILRPRIRRRWYWGVDPAKSERIQEWRGLRNHHEQESEMTGQSRAAASTMDEARYEPRTSSGTSGTAKSTRAPRSGPRIRVRRNATPGNNAGASESRWTATRSGPLSNSRRSSNEKVITVCPVELRKY